MSEKELQIRANGIWNTIIVQAKKKWEYTTYYEKIAEDELKKIMNNEYNISSLKESISKGFDLLKEVLDKDW